MDIPFTQFMRPDGRKVPTLVDRPEPLALKAMAVIEKGGRFTCEVLMNGIVSLACEYEDGDVAMELSNNGPEVEAATDKMIEDAYDYVVLRKR